MVILARRPVARSRRFNKVTFSTRGHPNFGLFNRWHRLPRNGVTKSHFLRTLKYQRISVSLYPKRCI